MYENSFILENPQDTHLFPYIGQEVSVFWSRNGVRKNFETSVCVFGKLEYNEGAEQFRVLANNDNYSYFSAEDVYRLGGPLSNGKMFIALK